MEQSGTPSWLSRSTQLLGEEAMLRLSRATVAVFGLGGVGSYTAEALARAGIGGLVLVDGDVVSDTNRNRQLIALCSTVGRPKAEVMAERVRDINPACRVTAAQRFYLPGEGEELLEGCDFAADAVDTVAAKIGLVEACAARGIPLISAMGCGNKRDPSRFRVEDLAKTTVCPLCRVMRRELKKRGLHHLLVVFSDEPPLPSAETEEELRPGKHALPGSLSFVPGAAGLVMAGEIVRRLTNPPGERA